MGKPDGYLQSVERPQIFGTVYFRDGQRKSFDKIFLSDPLREGFCVPPLAEQEKNVEMLKQGGSPVGLKRIASSCKPVDVPSRTENAIGPIQPPLQSTP
jgi:hypothetical protein